MVSPPLDTYYLPFEIYRKETLPRAWGNTQNSLGLAFYALAGRSEGPQDRNVPEAIGCRLSQCPAVSSPAMQQPPYWAATEIHLMHCAPRAGGAERGTASGGGSGAVVGRLSKRVSGNKPRAAAARMGDDSNQSRQCSQRNLARRTEGRQSA